VVLHIRKAIAQEPPYPTNGILGNTQHKKSRGC
jgi:hypothetical protein